MSLQDTLIYGLKTLWVNAVQQYDKSDIEITGPGVSVAVANNRNVVRVDSTILYSVGAAGMTIVAGNSVCKGPVASGVQVLDPGGDPWNKIFRGVAVNAGGIGDPISVQSYGETAGINHTLWAYKPTDEDIGSTVYAAQAGGYTMTPSATPGEFNQIVGSVWYADNEPLSDTTTILLNIQPPVIVPAS